MQPVDYSLNPGLITTLCLSWGMEVAGNVTFVGASTLEQRLQGSDGTFQSRPLGSLRQVS